MFFAKIIDKSYVIYCKNKIFVLSLHHKTKGKHYDTL